MRVHAETLLREAIYNTKTHEDDDTNRDNYDGEVIEIFMRAQMNNCKYGPSRGTILHALLTNPDNELQIDNKLHIVRTIVEDRDPNMMDLLITPDINNITPIHILMNMPDREMSPELKEDMKNFFVEHDLDDYFTIDPSNNRVTIKKEPENHLLLPQRRNNVSQAYLDELSAILEDNESEMSYGEETSELEEEFIIREPLGRINQGNELIQEEEAQFIMIGGLNRINQDNNPVQNEGNIRSFNIIKTSKGNEYINNICHKNQDINRKMTR